jgi:hypothetical protein
MSASYVTPVLVEAGGKVGAAGAGAGAGAFVESSARATANAVTARMAARANFIVFIDLSDLFEDKTPDFRKSFKQNPASDWVRHYLTFFPNLCYNARMTEKVTSAGSRGLSLHHVRQAVLPLESVRSGLLGGGCGCYPQLTPVNPNQPQSNPLKGGRGEGIHSPSSIFAAGFPPPLGYANLCQPTPAPPPGGYLRAARTYDTLNA